MRIASLLLVAIVASSCATPTEDSAVPRRSELGGVAPNGLSWVREAALKECVRESVADSTLHLIALAPDSAEAVTLSHAFLGERGARQIPVRVENWGAGIIVQLRDTTPGVVDRTHLVYVDSERCVTHLGW